MTKINHEKLKNKHKRSTKCFDKKENAGFEKYISQLEKQAEYRDRLNAASKVRF